LGRRRRGPAPRRLVQLYAALLYNAHLRGFAEGKIYTGPLKSVCVPGLNCYSCPGAVAACPLGALQNAVAGSADRPAFYVVGLLLLFGLLLGRVICGFLCPFGLLQELLYKIPVKKVRKSAVTRKLSRVKYGILAVFAVGVPVWFALRRLPLPAFCKYICPAGTLEGAFLLLIHPANGALRAMTGGLFWWKFTVLILVLVACVFIFRAFCRFLCPLGALYGLLSRLALLGVKVDGARCTDCGACVRICPMDIRSVGDMECVHCGNCIQVCPVRAISFRAGKIVLRGPDLGTEGGRE
jgi:polyferredoxin